MFVSRSIQADHKDLIHDVAYDFYGRRLATCSSDQSVKVWDLGEDGQWKCSSSWKTHSGSVWKVTWAHPDFGQVIATCSFDRTAVIWEEISTIIESSSSETSQTHWIKKATLVDSRTSVTDVKFAPKHLGLLLATTSSDGLIRIYEAPDIMNLGSWPLRDEFTCKMSCSSITWNPSRIHPPMIAVGCDDTTNATSPKVIVYEYNENSRKWYQVAAVSSIVDPVHDIAFAPNVGRPYHQLGIATKDLRVVVLKPLDPPSDRNSGTFQSNSKSEEQVSSRFDVRQVAQFEDHVEKVWRVAWNITGTILASSGDDGTVKLWKANYLESWKNVATLVPDGQAN